MRIVCPFCAAAYDVPDGLLAGREAVRCARCAKEWHPDVPEPVQEPAPAPEQAPEQAVETRLEPPPAPPRVTAARAVATPSRSMAGGDWAIDRLMAAPQPARGRLALALAWIASIAVVLALLGAAYAWRAEIMGAWPPSVHLYAALGLVPDAP